VNIAPGKPSYIQLERDVAFPTPHDTKILVQVSETPHHWDARALKEGTDPKKLRIRLQGRRNQDKDRDETGQLTITLTDSGGSTPIGSDTVNIPVPVNLVSD
jgi:hypothetical protein